MSSSPVTASSESDSPSNSSSSDSHPSPPSPESSSPPPSGSGSDESEASPPPPPASSSPPPTSQNSSSSDVSPPPPPRDKSSSGPSSSRSGNPPPPPPHSSSSGKTPSDSTTAISPSGSKSRQSPPRDGNDDNNGKVIAGVAIGIGLLIVMLIIICVRRAGRKKKKRKQYCYGGPPTGGENCYDDTPHNLQWHNKPQGVDHVVKLSPQAGGWVPAPPPMAHSSEDSSMFSGPHGPPMPPPSPSIALGFNKSTFTYEELAAATGGFAQANLLGQGGFGYVHKGVLPNGKEVAVKSLKSGSGQGEREFMAEVEIISRVHHRHLVSLVGYCVAGAQRMLVYEFVPNNTLEYHLHGKGLPVMDFSRRLRIALGSAKGLAYIHEDCYPRIIHRDIKSANILLDYNFEAMVADFGLAKLSSDSYTHVSTRVMGTFGYLAPEYASSGKLTEKSDVFSFGIMLLELITGKPPVDVSNVMEDSLVDWARPLLTSAMEDGNYDELADPRLELNYNPQEMARMVTCAAASIRHSARKRPKMSQIVRALEGDVSLDDLNEGIKPGHSSIYSMGSDYSQSSYHADMKKFRQIALASTEFPSSEYGTSSNDSREAPTSRKPN